MLISLPSPGVTQLVPGKRYQVMDETFSLDTFRSLRRLFLVKVDVTRLHGLSGGRGIPVIRGRRGADSGLNHSPLGLLL